MQPPMTEGCRISTMAWQGSLCLSPQEENATKNILDHEKVRRKLIWGELRCAL